LTSLSGTRTVGIMRSVFSILIITLLTPLTGLTTNVTAKQAPEHNSKLESLDLPVSIERIRRQLDRLPVVKSRGEVLRLNLYIRVYAQAAPINVFDGFDLQHGPLPYATPTHAMMKDVTTPVEFRAPAVTLGNGLGWTWGGR
jgi:hypothetical protein